MHNVIAEKLNEFFLNLGDLEDRELIIIAFFILAIPFVFWYIVQAVRKERKIRLQKLDDIIFRNSIALLELNKITSETRNKLYYGLPECFKSEVFLDSKDKFNRFDPRREAPCCLYEQRESYISLAQNAFSNRKEYSEYRKKERHIYRKLGYPKKDVLEELKKIGFDQDRYIEREREIYCSWILQCPITSIEYRLEWSYTSPRGRNHYYNHRIYNQGQCFQMLEEEKNRRRNFEEYQSTAQYERSQMSPSLRFKVMRRDHYRCCICGRGQEDGVKLEVDHKIPVSKGGKTEMSNLWTLCFECNRGKSNKDL